MALTILTGSSQAAATNYSYTTSGSADWASVPTASYFYDITDKTVRFKATNSTYSNIATASLALTASNVVGTVTSASYAMNGGVTQLLAGSGISLSPSSGTGSVTVTSLGSVYNTMTGSYGSFYDTGSVLATSATTIYSMSLNTTDISNGVYISASNGNNTRVKFTNAGTYNIQFSSQFSNTDNSTQDVVVWIRKNGTDIPDSTGTVGVPPYKAGSNGQALAAWNYYLNLSSDDYIQLCWHVEQANVITLETIAAGTGPTHPRTPSTILTATRVDTFLSNTGSFSGSFNGVFTGSLQGTATNADNATNAGYSTNAGFATNAGAVLDYSYASPDQINIGDLSTTNYDYIVRAQELESSKFATINIFNFLNF